MRRTKPRPRTTPVEAGVIALSVARRVPRFGKDADRIGLRTQPLALSVALPILALERKVDCRKPPFARHAHPIGTHQVHHGLVIAEGILERILKSLRILSLVCLEFDEAQ